MSLSIKKASPSPLDPVSPQKAFNFKEQGEAVRRTAALIIGGGPAGCAAAICLGRAGLSPELIERTDGPHDAVCGGFLGWDALAALERLGIDSAALGARPIRRLRLIAARRQVEAPMPKPSAGLSRRALDAALLAAATQAGAIVTRGRTAKAADATRRIVRLDTCEEIEAEALLLATGKYELRGAARPKDTSRDPIGLRTALAPSAEVREAIEGVIELHLFDGGYAGLLLQEDGMINLCLSVARERLKRAGGIPALVHQILMESPQLAERLGPEILEWNAVSGSPYGWRARGTSPGLFRLGDQAAVISSIAGDGIAIALESGIAAAIEMAGGHGDALAFQRDLSARTARSLMVAEILRWMAEHRMPRAAMMNLIGSMPGLAQLAARLTRIGR